MCDITDVIQRDCLGFDRVWIAPLMAESSKYRENQPAAPLRAVEVRPTQSHARTLHAKLAASRHQARCIAAIAWGSRRGKSTGGGSADTKPRARPGRTEKRPTGGGDFRQPACQAGRDVRRETCTDVVGKAASHERPQCGVTTRPRKRNQIGSTNIKIGS